MNEIGVVQRLLPSPEDEMWRGEAACRGMNPALFFPDSISATRKIKAVCESCPVTEPCLVYALKYKERDGIWGGLTPRQRRAIRKVEYLSKLDDDRGPRIKRAADHNEPTQHGTRSCYSHTGCRLPECTAAQNEYQRQWRIKKRQRA